MALNDINFNIQQGDRVGIIGRNGAGKSTLLKILSRITEPSSGRITIRGRVASLLEVGTGFHPELTGRENIFLNGAILGMNRTEIRSKFDEIVSFAEIEKFLDTPVKRYSSGMYVRLAFAVAAHLEPEILVVDEVLAVGDAQFQKKCLGKMEDVSKNQGRTVLFVSHNMGVIANLCNKGYLLQNGNLVFTGKASEAINLYLDSADKTQGYQNDNNQSTSFNKVFFNSIDGGYKNEFAHNEPIRISLRLQGVSQRSIDVGIAVLDKFKSKIFTTIKNIQVNPGVNTFGVECEIPDSFLAPGTYSIDVALFNSKVTTYEYISDILPFRVIDNGTELAAFENADYGNVLCNCTWTTLTH
ncbi:ABC transporter ATP-binding protein [Paraflavitalea speifideaquila]|uniref:ABC transporter ATP-binding protein n=1 Tax=Paraflavitalea speifideaquila TaxID=3076558 RepID=UPI0028E25993|nr:ABC transporter ATP-binding protein [Paraflavitalea speifideiaquila]